MRYLLLLFLLPVNASATLSDGQNEFTVRETRQVQVDTTPRDFSTSFDDTNSARSNSRTDNRQNDLTANGEVLNGSNTNGSLRNANNAKSKGNAVKMLGFGMAAAFGGLCAAGDPGTRSWACPAAAMSAMDALSAMRSENNAGRTGSFLDPSAFGVTDFDFDDPEALAALDTLNDVRAAGFTPNSDGSITLPNGNIVTSSDLNSEDGLKGVGLSPSQAKKVVSQIGDLKNQVLSDAGIGEESLAGDANEVLLEEGGARKTASSGGSSYGSSAGQAYGADGNIIVEEEIVIGGKKRKGRIPASKASRLRKNFNGTPIGIGMANLFLTVHKCYTAELCPHEKNKFITKEH